MLASLLFARASSRAVASARRGRQPASVSGIAIDAAPRAFARRPRGARRPVARLLVGLALASIAGVSGAAAKGCAPTHFEAGEIAAAIARSPEANPVLRRGAYIWGGAGKSESGGNLCASNGYNFGVLQLNVMNLPRGTTPSAYMEETLQQQVDTWAAQVGDLSVLTPGYQALDQAMSNDQPIGDMPVTSGMMAACLQFGPSICANDVAALRNGQPCGGAHPININWTLRHPGSATTDGNGQTICSWGGVMKANIETAAAACVKAGAPCAPPRLTDYPLRSEGPRLESVIL